MRKVYIVYEGTRHEGLAPVEPRLAFDRKETAIEHMELLVEQAGPESSRHGPDPHDGTVATVYAANSLTWFSVVEYTLLEG